MILAESDGVDGVDGVPGSGSKNEFTLLPTTQHYPFRAGTEIASSTRNNGEQDPWREENDLDGQHGLSST